MSQSGSKAQGEEIDLSRFGALLDAYAQARAFQRSSPYMRVVENSLRQLLGRGLGGKEPPALLVALAGVMGELFFIELILGIHQGAGVPVSRSNQEWIRAQVDMMEFAAYWLIHRTRCPDLSYNVAYSRLKMLFDERMTSEQGSAPVTASQERSDSKWPQHRINRLRACLEFLYGRPSDIARVAREAGMTTTRISFSGSAHDVWNAVLAAALELQGVDLEVDYLDAIIRVAKSEYPLSPLAKEF